MTLTSGREDAFCTSCSSVSAVIGSGGRHLQILRNTSASASVMLGSVGSSLRLLILKGMQSHGREVGWKVEGGGRNVEDGGWKVEAEGSKS